MLRLHRYLIYLIPYLKQDGSLGIYKLLIGKPSLKQYSNPFYFLDIFYQNSVLSYIKPETLDYSHIFYQQPSLLTKIIIENLKLKKKMANKCSSSSLKAKISEFQQANVNFATKMEDFRFNLKLFPLETIQEHIAKAASILTKVKWLILLHNLVMDCTYPNFQDIDRCLAAFTIEANTSTNSFDSLVSEKFIVPYKLYLQKRSFYGSVYQNNDNQYFQLINLIRNALAFTDFIFTIGRYMYKSNKFLGEFVIAMGRDLSLLYKKMKTQLTQEMMVEHAEIIEKMNEGLYNIYYNCYFSQLAARMAPIWINTEILFKKRTEKGHANKSSPSKRIKQVEETIILEEFKEPYEHSIIQLEDLALESIQPCEPKSASLYEPKSTSTIQSNNEKESKEHESGQISSRREFLFLAQNLLQEIEKMESYQRVIY